MEKSEQCQSYIENEVGIDTWMLLKLYEINCFDIFNYIKLNLVLVENEDFMKKANLFVVKSSQSDLIRIKQHLLLEVIMKLEIVIETLLVLLDSLHGNYRKLPSKLIRYKQQLIFSIIKRMRDRHYPISYLLGFPPTKFLPISDKEKEFLFANYQKVDNIYYDIVNRLCNFYEKFLIIYGKSKHGLTIIPELMIEGTIVTFKNSSLLCLDKKTKNELKGKYFESDLISDNFNTVAYLNFNDDLFNEIKTVVADLKKIISITCDLNKKRIINCGESYFLFQSIDDKHTNWFWPEALSENDRVIIDGIARKILPWYYEPKSEILTTTFKVTRDDIVQSLITNAVTIVHDPNLLTNSSTSH
jgi:hypothetical protein